MNKASDGDPMKELKFQQTRWKSNKDLGSLLDWAFDLYQVLRRAVHEFSKCEQNPENEHKMNNLEMALFVLASLLMKSCY